ncbi:MAG: SH3 domain-containing protein [Pseudomonadota bacterium]
MTEYLSKSIRIGIAAICATGVLAFSGAAWAESVGRKSGLPLPRFVSLKSKAVNLRVGPGRQYSVSWLYVKSGLPVEVIQEFDQWRRVRDSEGTEGWVYHSLLTGKRTAIIAPWSKSEKSVFVEAHSQPNADAHTVAKLQAGVVVKVNECERGWCEVTAGDVDGYVDQQELWGVYPEEPVKG